jgi:hypothetical protein
VVSNRFEQQIDFLIFFLWRGFIYSKGARSTFFNCSGGDGVQINLTPHNKRASPRKNGTGEKTGSGGVLQVKGLIRKSSVVHKAGVYV